MKKTEVVLNEMLEFLQEQAIPVEYAGDERVAINGICPIDACEAHSLTWIKDINSAGAKLPDDKLNLVIVTKRAVEAERLEGYNRIECEDPKMVFFALTEAFFEEHPAPDISIHSVVGANQIGKRVSIGHHCSIAEDVVIGDDVCIHHNVTIEGPAEIGAHTVIHSGVVIGARGFGIYQDIAGNNKMVPHLGGVKIGAHVEIGANTCIDKGTIADTCIGDYVKIDNLCHISHNVNIKENAIIVCGSIVLGSATVGERSYMAPGSILFNQKKIGDNVLVGTGAVVVNDVEDEKVVYGIPAKVIRDNT